MNGAKPNERGEGHLEPDRDAISEGHSAPEEQGKEQKLRRPAQLVSETKKILFVDDDRDWREVVGSFLADAGFEVLTASDATEGMAGLEQFEPDLIALDLNLAGESGLMLMSFLKRNKPDARVVLFTGLSHDNEQIQEMLKLGAQQYVRKGPLEDLLKAVKASLSSSAPAPS
jgi:two-component system, OmpR family, response regulator